jgi:hypothetical protein
MFDVHYPPDTTWKWPWGAGDVSNANDATKWVVVQEDEFRRQVLKCLDEIKGELKRLRGGG